MLQYHPLIEQSNASLGSSREVTQGCGVSFINCLYLVPLIISQNFCATCASINQTWPQYYYSTCLLQYKQRDRLRDVRVQFLASSQATYGFVLQLVGLRWVQRLGGVLLFVKTVRYILLFNQLRRFKAKSSDKFSFLFPSGWACCCLFSLLACIAMWTFPLFEWRCVDCTFSPFIQVLV